LDAAENPRGVALLETVQRARCGIGLDVHERGQARVGRPAFSL
jgi:hypothetical protein